MRNRCVDCNKYYNDDQLIFSEKDQVPHCECGGLIRPDVVWFGESLPAYELEMSFKIARICDAFFSVGTSAVVQPAASLPLEAIQAGAYVVEINSEPTVITNYVHESIIGKSGEVLPKLVKEIQHSSNKSI